MWILGWLFLFSSIQSHFTTNIAVTIDDLPFAYSRGLTKFEKEDAYHRVLETLEKYDIQAAAFIIGQPVNNKTLPYLRAFKERGHILGNHTYSHPDLNRVSAEDYTRNIQRCEEKISSVRDSIKYFRYSYLHRGNTIERRDSVYTWLDEENYTIVPVSIDNDEWMFNRDYVDAYAEGDSTAMDSIGNAYIQHMIMKSEYFDSLGYSLTKHRIDHILLIHMNLINADYLDELFAWYENNNWKFITVPEAISCPVYSYPEEYIGNNGISYLKRIKQTQH